MLHLRALLTALVVVPALVMVSACRSSSNEAAAPAATTVPADTWATVNGRAITRGEVERAYRRTRDVAQTLAPEEELIAKLGLLDDLILEDLLIEKAAALKVEVPPTELDTAYNEAKSNIPDQAFQEELTRRNVTAEDMREGLRRQLLAQKIIEREVTSKITVSDQEITEFFNTNRAQFNLAEEAFHVAQIIVTPVREPRLANRTGDDATTVPAAQQKAQMLMEKLKGGADFGEVARDYSEDLESAPRGGDMGFMPRSALAQAPPALRDAILTANPGTVRVVQQDGAIALVLLVAREAAGQRELTTPGVRDRITQTLRARKEQLLRAAYIANLRDEAEIANHQVRRVVQSQGVPQ